MGKPICDCKHLLTTFYQSAVIMSVISDRTDGGSRTKNMCSQSNRNVRHNGFRRSGGKREYVQARAGPNHRGAQGPRYNQRRPQGQSAEGQYRAGTPVDALNMNFQGDRSAFHKTGRPCTINAAYNGKKFKARGVITEAERQRILAQCPPRSAECKAWDNAASVAAIKAFYGSDPYEQKIFRV